MNILIKFVSFLSEPNGLVTFFVYLVIIIAIYKFLSFIFKTYYRKKEILNLYKYLVYCILVLELGLRFLGKYDTYFEKKAGKYESIYKYRPQNALHKRQANDSFLSASQNEFSYQFVTNSWGYSDQEWTPNDSNSFKILVLGDSFTEGVGTPQDSSWVAQISKFDTAKKLQGFNAGIAASDPFTNFYALEKELKNLNPNLIIQIYTNQDFNEDILLRGGMKRFKNEYLSYPSHSKMEIFYAYSHIYRMIYHRKSDKRYYVSKSDLKKLDVESSFQELIQLYNRWTIQNQIPVLLIFFHTESYYYSIADSFYPLDIENRKVSQYLKIKSVSACYRNEFKKRGDSFHQLWWENDGHHNSEGYKMMAKCIEDVISQELISLYDEKMNQKIVVE